MEDNLDLYEEREHEVLEQLGRMNMDDANRKALVSELTALSSIRNSYEQTEQTRLNNNARNDIEEQKLVIEEEKVKNDKKRTIAMWVQTFLSVGVGGYLTFKSYNMDEHGYPFKELKEFARGLVSGKGINRGR